MKQLFRFSFLLVIAAGMFTSCKNNTPKEARYIPKEASFVLTLDPHQLQDKLQKGGISVDTLISRIFKNEPSDEKSKVLFSQLKDSAGLDWSGKFFVFMLQKNQPDNSISNTVSVMGSLKDAAQMESFVKSHHEISGKEIKKEKDYSYLILHEGSMLAWNDQQVIATMYTHTKKAVYDTAAMTFKRPEPADTESEMKTAVSRYFTQKVNESLAGVEIFTEMFKEKADGYLFSSANSSLAGLSMLPLQLPKLEEFLKDNYTTATLSFEEGRIIAKSTSYVNPLLGSVLKQYAGPTVNLSLLEKYPSQNINGIIMAAFNPEIFGGILKQLEVEGIVNSFMEKSGISSQDLYKSLKGDIAVIVSDFDVSEREPEFKTDEHNMTHKKPFAKMIFNAPVGDKASFHKIMDKAVEQGFLKKVGTTYKAGNLASFMGIFISADDQSLIIASDSVTYAQYISNTAKAVINKEAIDRFKGKSTVLYIDVAGTLNGFNKDSSGSFSKSLHTAKATFKDVLGTSENFDGKNIKAQFEVRLQNEKQNSLVTLTSLLTDIAVDMRVQAKKEKETEDRLFPGGVPAIIRTN